MDNKYYFLSFFFMIIGVYVLCMPWDRDIAPLSLTFFIPGVVIFLITFFKNNKQGN